MILEHHINIALANKKVLVQGKLINFLEAACRQEFKANYENA